MRNGLLAAVAAFGLALTVGCGPESKTEAAATPPQSQVSGGSAASGAPVGGGSSGTELKGDQLVGFFTQLGELDKHGGWDKAQVEGTVTQMKGIPVGETKSGDIHMDWDGKHLDVTMKVVRTSEDGFALSFTSPEEGLNKAIEAKLASAAK